MDATHEVDTSRSAIYYPVSSGKFIVLSVLTWGIYELYWFYKNWSFVRHRDGSGILPFWRAVFCPLWYPALLLDFRRNQGRTSISTPDVVFPSLTYLILGSMWHLDDPFWLIAWLSFAPLLPMVQRINARNPENSLHYASNSSWKLRHLLLAALSAPSIAFVIASSVGAIPSTQVTPGWMLWSYQREHLENSGIIEAGERVLYFYSRGPFSIRDDGQLLTERGVISYWRNEESNELSVKRADFSEIADVAYEYGNWIDPTSVKISRHDSSWFELLLSAEAERDRVFLRRLDELRAP